MIGRFMVLVLDRSDVLSLLTMREVIEAVHQVHHDLATAVVVQPGREAVHIDGSTAGMIPMIAASSRTRLGCVKVLVDAPGNVGTEIPMQQSTIVLVNMDNGTPEAFIQGGAVTLFRTAAASAVATRVLSRDDSHVLGFVGAGAQARPHLRAICAVREIRRVSMWSRSEESVTAFAKEVRDQGLEAEIMSSPEAVVRDCDILCTLTPSRDPIVRGEWFHPGQHLNAVGAPPRDDHREIDTLGIQRSTVVVDEYRTALTESGDVMIPVREGAITVDDFRTELGQVLAGHKRGRASDSEITLFDSVGLAIQDLAAAGLALKLAKARGVGKDIKLV